MPAGHLDELLNRGSPSRATSAHPVAVESTSQTSSDQMLVSAAS